MINLLAPFPWKWKLVRWPNPSSVLQVISDDGSVSFQVKDFLILLDPCLRERKVAREGEVFTVKKWYKYLEHMWLLHCSKLSREQRETGEADPWLERSQLLACAMNAACAALVDAGIPLSGLLGRVPFVPLTYHLHLFCYPATSLPCLYFGVLLFFIQFLAWSVITNIAHAQDSLLCLWLQPPFNLVWPALILSILEVCYVWFAFLGLHSGGNGCKLICSNLWLVPAAVGCGITHEGQVFLDPSKLEEQVSYILDNSYGQPLAKFILWWT